MSKINFRYVKLFKCKRIQNNFNCITSVVQAKTKYLSEYWMQPLTRKQNGIFNDTWFNELSNSLFHVDDNSLMSKLRMDKYFYANEQCVLATENIVRGFADAI